MTTSKKRKASLRRTLLRDRYLLKDAEGRVIETPRQMLIRVAKAVAKVDAEYGTSEIEIRNLARKFFRLMRRRMFLPNSPTLMNAGREKGMCCARAHIVRKPAPGAIKPHCTQHTQRPQPYRKTFPCLYPQQKLDAPN